MSSIVFLGNLEGGSSLLAGEHYCGEVRHSIRIYQDALCDIVVAAGEIWGDDLVLQHAAVGQSVTLRLEDGRTVRVVVQRRSLDKTHVCIGVDGAVPGFWSGKSEDQDTPGGEPLRFPGAASL
jgi:hypothetical protein